MKKYDTIAGCHIKAVLVKVYKCVMWVKNYYLPD